MQIAEWRIEIKDELIWGIVTTVDWFFHIHKKVIIKVATTCYSLMQNHLIYYKKKHINLILVLKISVK